MALQPITDALHLIHGPDTCLGHSWESRPTQSAGSTLHRLTLSTGVSELDVVFGGEAKLGKAIDALIARSRPAALFVYQTCLPSMTGDDLAAACRAASLRCGCPVVAVDAPGIEGGKLWGAQRAADILVDEVIGTREPEVSTDRDVLLVGDFNVAGEADHIAALLARIGVRVVASIPGGGRFADIAAAHRARLTLAHCSQAIGDLAAALERKFGVPYLQASFYGARQTSDTLRAAAARLVAGGAAPELVDDCERFVAAEEQRLQTRLRPLRPALAGKRALLLTGGVKTWSLATSLRDLGLDVVGANTAKASPDDRRRLDAALAGAAGRDLQRWLAEERIDVALGGGGARLAATAAGAAWVEVNHERRRSFTGYDGMARLAEEIAAALALRDARTASVACPW
jgi:nitrogenase molybdenum-cofactor synthesis protein NifE